MSGIDDDVYQEYMVEDLTNTTQYFMHIGMKKTRFPR